MDDCEACRLQREPQQAHDVVRVFSCAQSWPRPRHAVHRRRAQASKLTSRAVTSASARWQMPSHRHCWRCQCSMARQQRPWKGPRVNAAHTTQELSDMGPIAMCPVAMQAHQMPDLKKLPVVKPRRSETPWFSPSACHRLALCRALARHHVKVGGAGRARRCSRVAASGVGPAWPHHQSRPQDLHHQQQRPQLISTSTSWAQSSAYRSSGNALRLRRGRPRSRTRATASAQSGASKVIASSVGGPRYGGRPFYYHRRNRVVQSEPAPFLQQFIAHHYGFRTATVRWGYAMGSRCGNVLRHLPGLAIATRFWCPRTFCPEASDAVLRGTRPAQRKGVLLFAFAVSAPLWRAATRVAQRKVYENFTGLHRTSLTNASPVKRSHAGVASHAFSRRG